MELRELYALQLGLDKEIMEKHPGVSYETTKEKRILALLVELGEFANETRTFKFWSLKGPSEKEVILDEYADAIHFFLSLGLTIGIDSFEHRFNKMVPFANLTEAIIDVYQKVVDFSKNTTKELYEEAFHSYLDILPQLGYNGDDMLEAYHKKLKVNYVRQETHY